jgi:hypothetical protein
LLENLSINYRDSSQTTAIKLKNYQPEEEESMKKLRKSRLGLAMILTFITSGLFLPDLTGAGNLEPPGPPAPTMRTLDQIDPRIPIANLPLDIKQPGSYYLISDL